MPFLAQFHMLYILMVTYNGYLLLSFSNCNRSVWLSSGNFAFSFVWDINIRSIEIGTKAWYAFGNAQLNERKHLFTRLFIATEKPQDKYDPPLFFVCERDFFYSFGNMFIFNAVICPQSKLILLIVLDMHEINACKQSAKRIHSYNLSSQLNSLSFI